MIGGVGRGGERPCYSVHAYNSSVCTGNPATLRNPLLKTLSRNFRLNDTFYTNYAKRIVSSRSRGEGEFPGLPKQSKRNERKGKVFRIFNFAKCRIMEDSLVGSVVNR